MESKEVLVTRLFEELREAITDATTKSREQSVAFTQLDTAELWAEKAMRVGNEPDEK